MKYTHEQKKEARDFLTEVIGINLDHCDPDDLDDVDVYEVRQSLVFKLWDFRNRFKNLVQTIFKKQ